MQELSFCTAGVSGKGLRVEKDGTGLWQVWKSQIQQFNRVSPATAAAIAEAYPSPGLLVQVSQQQVLVSIWGEHESLKLFPLDQKLTELFSFFFSV